MKYEIVMEATNEKTILRVNTLLAKGWKLLGQPFTRDHLICQAVTHGEYPRPNRVKAKEEKRNGE